MTLKRISASRRASSGTNGLPSRSNSAIFNFLYRQFLIIFALKKSITAASSELFNIFLHSQIASHTAAGALLFTQLLLIGCPCEVQPDVMIASAISVLTDLSLIHVKCPFNYGIFDGLLMLLNQMLNQGEQMIADQFLETQLWDLLWSRVSQALKPAAAMADEPMETEQTEEQHMVIGEPEWTFLSPSGFISVLNLASRMLTMSTQNCVTLFIKNDSIMFDSLSYMLSDCFMTR